MAIRVVDRASQQEVEVSPDVLQEDIERGTGRFVVPSGQLFVRREGHRTGQVDAADVERALAEGWKISDQETNKTTTIRREESGVGGQALGALEAGASGLSLGASTAIAEGLGLVDPKRAQARRDAAGGLADAAELAGMALPGLLTGGTSAVGTAAGKTLTRRVLAKTPAALATRAGRAVESGVAKVLPRGASTLVPTTAGQFVEGIAFGAGHEWDDATLGRRDVVASNILAGGLMDAGLAGALGLVLPGVTRVAAGASRMSAGAIDKVLSRGTGEVIERTGKPSLVAKAMATASGADLDTVQEGLDLLRTPQGRRHLSMTKLDHADEVEKLGQEIGGSVDAANEAVSVALRNTEGKSYMRDVELPAGAELVVPRMTDEVLNKIGGRLDELAARAEKYNDADVRAIVDDARDVVDGGRRAIADAAGDPRAAMRRADQVRSQLSEIEQRARRARVSGYVADDMFSELRDVRRSISSHLQDESVFGRAARIQAEGDALQAAALAARRGVPGKRSAAQRVLDRSEPTTADDLVKVARKFGQDGPGAMEESLAAVFDKELAYLRWIKENREVPPEFDGLLARAESNYAGLRETIKKNRERLRANDVMQRLRDAESGGSVSIGSTSNMGAWVGSAVGAAAMGPLGAALGATAGRAISSPFTTIRTLAAIGRLADRAGLRLDGAMGKFIATMRSGASPQTRAKLRDAARRFTRGASSVAGAASVVSMSERRERADKLERRIRQLAADPSMLAQELEPALLDVREHAPALADEIASQLGNAASYLAAHAPRRYQPPMGPPSKIGNPVEEARWQRRVETVLDPAGVVEKLADGSITREHVEALRACFPAIYEQIRDAALEELAAAADEQRAAPFDLRIRVGQLFEVVTDPSHEPGVMLALQASYGRTGAREDARASAASTPGRTSTKALSRRHDQISSTDKTEV